MPKGGLRPRADGSLDHLIKPMWRSGQTQTIRVPVILAERLLDYARSLDAGEVKELTQDNTEIEDLKARAQFAEILLTRCEKLEQRWAEREGLITDLRKKLGELGRKTQFQERAISLLKAALELKPNAGGAIKAEIRKALMLLGGK